ncbi:Lrp/AsnC family transcriptional regulator [Candidatus Micrarchaeota archaeon]|nr:Lrp/AsnC family transcriptional regulator [Candidatus Micrarchaeota archaeon]
MVSSLDRTNKRIIDLLKENSRMKNTEIAAEVGLSEGAIRKRIEMLLRKGDIKRFTIETPTRKRAAIVMMRSKGSDKLALKAIKELGIAERIYDIYGEYDGCVVIEGEDLEDIDEKIGIMRSLGRIRDTKTYIVLKRWL